jgi:signal transduction histidine kinase/ActR/RegA family two-component response regulator
MRLRTKVFQLTLLTVIPTIAFTIVLALVLLEREAEIQRDGALNRNRAFMTAVDSEMRGHELTLHALAASSYLQAGALRTFHDEMVRVLESQPDYRSISLASVSHEQILNTSRPFGTQLPMVGDSASFEHALKEGKPAIGGMMALEVNEGYGIPVRIPVMVRGNVRYVLTAMLNPKRFERLIEEQDLRPSWVSGLVDRRGTVIARIPFRKEAEKASEAFLEATTKSTEGWYRGKTLEGLDSYTAYKTSDYTGWSIGFAMPSSEVNVSAWRAIWLVGLGAAILIGLALPFSFWISRQVADPITDLLKMARSLGDPGIVSNPSIRSPIREARELAQAFVDAAATINERQQALEQEKAALQAADRAKDEFLAMLGHELRNPLSAVINASSLLRQPGLSPENLNAAEGVLERQTAQLDRLVNDLLDVGRVVSGKIEIERAPIELGSVIDAAVQAIKTSGRARARVLSINHSDAVYVLGDFARLQQVVMNLLSNAIAHTDEKDSIEVSVTREGESAVLCVADTGSGFEEKDRTAIFDLFYQVDRELHRRGGLGIGLTLVKRLVEMHGGTVTAFSAGLDKGAQFIVRLPLTAANTLAEDEKDAGEQAARPLKILLIDDNEDVRISMRLLLEEERHKVSVAVDGREGVDTALASKPQVAIVDIGMPGMDGYDVARELREKFGNDIFLIAMTGYGAPQDVQLAKDAGFDEHITKPASFPDLTAMLTMAAHSLHVEPAARVSRKT